MTDSPATPDVRQAAQRPSDLVFSLEPHGIALARPALVDVASNVEMAGAQLRQQARDPSDPAGRQQIDSILASARYELEHHNAALDKAARTISLNAALHNKGESAIGELRLIIDFPECVASLWHSEARWASPFMPDETTPRTRFFQLHLPGITVVPTTQIEMLPRLHPVTLQGRRILYDNLLIPPESRITLPTLHATIGDWRHVGKFAVKVHVRALRPLIDQKGELPVVVSIRDA